jgi:hypothetical protein
MLRHQGGEQAKAGFYLNLDSWEVNTVSGAEGGILAGGGQTRYLRVPTLAMLAFAPIMGAAFAMFLPFIGIALVAQYAATKTWRGVRQVSHGMVGTLGPAWHPSAAHLTGTPEDKRKAGTDAATATPVDAKLDSLEKEIVAQSKSATRH